MMGFGFLGLVMLDALFEFLEFGGSGIVGPTLSGFAAGHLTGVMEKLVEVFVSRWG